MLLDALTREMIEETGVKPMIGKLLVVHQFAIDGMYQGPEFFFEVTNVDDYLNIDLASTSHGSVELAQIGFFEPRTLQEDRKPAFLDDIDGLFAGHPRLVFDKDYA